MKLVGESLPVQLILRMELWDVYDGCWELMQPGRTPPWH